MSSYTILDKDNLSDVLKKKPPCVTFILVTVGLLAIIGSAIAIGIFIGYTYCYLEHHSGFRPVTGNISESSNYKIFNIPESEEVKYNKTFNGGWSSILVSRIFKMGPALVEEDFVPLQPEPWQNVHLQYT